MKTIIKAFIESESGAAAAEYALILAIAGTSIGLAAFTLGGSIQTAIQNVSTDISTCGGFC